MNQNAIKALQSPMGKSMCDFVATTVSAVDPEALHLHVGDKFGP